MAPTPTRPASIRAYVPGSGTAAAKVSEPSLPSVQTIGCAPRPPTLKGSTLTMFELTAAVLVQQDELEAAADHAGVREGRGATPVVRPRVAAGVGDTVGEDVRARTVGRRRVRGELVHLGGVAVEARTERVEREVVHRRVGTGGDRRERTLVTGRIGTGDVPADRALHAVRGGEPRGERGVGGEVQVRRERLLVGNPHRGRRRGGEAVHEQPEVTHVGRVVGFVCRATVVPGGEDEVGVAAGRELDAGVRTAGREGHQACGDERELGRDCHFLESPVD